MQKIRFWMGMVKGNKNSAFLSAEQTMAPAHFPRRGNRF